MDDFVNVVNRNWEQLDPVFLATYVLWRLNNIHPFINGNERTARAACYFVLCLKSGGWVRGQTILPELIRRERDEYCIHLQHAHDTFASTGNPDLGPLHGLVTRLFDEQLSTVADEHSTASATEPVLDVAQTEPRARRARQDGVVLLRYTIRKQSDDRFCIWDNDFDTVAEVAGSDLVDLQYDAAFSQMENLNGQ